MSIIQEIEMFALKVDKKFAEKARKFIAGQDLGDKKFKVKSDDKFVYFPIAKNLSPKQKKLLDISFSIAKINFNKVAQIPQSLKEALQEKLSKNELKLLVSGFDSLGEIAIIEIPRALIKKEKLIGETLLDLHRNLRIVCKKAGPHQGLFREEPVKIIAARKKGDKNLTAYYKEHACTFKIDVGKVFFSPRLSTERGRINKLITEGETVGCYFAGVGPFAIIIAKNPKAKKVIGVELNPKAVKNFNDNVFINKVENKVTVIEGDVNKVALHFPNYFDRITMPSPHTSHDFLDCAFHSIKKNGIIHYYNFGEKNNAFAENLKIIKAKAKANGKKIIILNRLELREFSPKTEQIVIDIKVI